MWAIIHNIGEMYSLNLATVSTAGGEGNNKCKTTAAAVVAAAAAFAANAVATCYWY